MTAKPAASGATESAPASGAADAAPRHVAIIMDGNGRWAAARGLKRADGHREGVAAARRAVEAARDLNVNILTLYSFSTENWRRPAGEVRDLMNLLRQFIGEDLPTLKREGVRVRIIGDKETLDRELRLLVSHAEKETSSNARFTLQIAFNYGGRDEIVRAARAAARAAAAGQIDPEALDEKLFATFLDTRESPEPDLVIRTSGEKRISNFLLWQAAYAEYVFLDVLWPDFDKPHFAAALDEYQRRERRFGGVGTV
ncbi:MAG: isoprenyl transferase [Pseudomonadota bacterium]|nr:isoprenyl transferase [Pseudomonadota bacterium]